MVYVHTVKVNYKELGITYNCMTMKNKLVFSILTIMIIAMSIFLVLGFINESMGPSNDNIVPHEDRWGIYALDLATKKIELLFSSSKKIDGLRLNNDGDIFVFFQEIADDGDECVLEGTPLNLCEEICIVEVDGSNFQRLTCNNFLDVYPSWSPNGSQIAFLTMRNATVDIYVMNADGNDVEELYDSGFHDCDIDWVRDKIVFTRNSQIWIMNDDGTDPVQITNPPRAGEWGNAVLPFGDFDPKLNPDGTKIVFERLEDDKTSHGNYDIYVINVDGTGEKALTDTEYTQGFPAWSHSGDEIAYFVGAIGNEGKYDIYLMNSDGTNNHNITPDYFPANFLCRTPIFSKDDSKILFIGEWYD